MVVELIPLLAKGRATDPVCLSWWAGWGRGHLCAIVGNIVTNPPVGEF